MPKPRKSICTEIGKCFHLAMGNAILALGGCLICQIGKRNTFPRLLNKWNNAAPSIRRLERLSSDSHCPSMDYLSNDNQFRIVRLIDI